MAVTAADIRRMLADGDSVAEIAARTGWKSASIQAIAEKPAVTDPVPEVEPGRALLALLARTIGALSRCDDPAVAKDVTRAREALERLEDNLTVAEKRRAAEADLAEAKRKVAEAEARLRQLKGARPSPKDIRAWCASQGIACSPRGGIPADVRARYDAAHAPEGSAA